MGLLEENPIASKFVDVRSLCLGMSAEAADPVVQVVDSDEQNVWPRNSGFCQCGSSPQNSRNQTLCEEVHYGHGFRDGSRSLNPWKTTTNF